MEETMSKLVGALLLELSEDVPDKPGYESVRADLIAASKVYEYGKKKDLTLRFYLAMRTLLHELERRKWVTRRASGSDARSHCLHLTADGEKALAKIKNLAERHEARLASHVEPKRHAQLMNLLRDFG